MVMQMGMSEVIGPRAIGATQPGMQAPQESKALKNRADEEVDRILTEQYNRGMDLLTENRDILDMIAKTLIEKEKITGDELLEKIKEMKPELIKA